MARILREDAERLLNAVPQDQMFWCCDGRTVVSMRDMAEALDNMPDETFYYHANGEKCDFGNWVRDVIGDEKLARDLVKSPSRAQAAKYVSARVAFLDTKLTT